MSAAEEIQQAIATLERLRAESTPGPWFCEDSGQESAPGFPAVWTDAEGVDLAATIARPDDFVMPRGVKPRGDMELIVTLHRTVDAQLAILQEAVEMLAPFAGMRLHEDGVRFQLALARAINGGAS